MKRLFFISFILALTVNAGASIIQAGKWAATEYQGTYKKIDVTAVPTDILRAISDSYSGYQVSEAWFSEDAEENEYKLVIAREGKMLTAYYKSTGEFIKEEMK